MIAFCLPAPVAELIPAESPVATSEPEFCATLVRSEVLSTEELLSDAAEDISGSGAGKRATERIIVSEQVELGIIAAVVDIEVIENG